MLDKLSMDEIITRALKEDIGTGDITTMSTVPAGQTINGRFIAKEAGIICGLEIVRRVFEIVNNEIQFKPLVNDGDAVLTGEVIASISGPAVGILMGERVALNFLQRLSGISSKTASLAKIIEGTGARISDTRKTTPGLRVFEKYAVKIGGGMNHRFNLSDGVLIKDNHIAAAGGISNAIEAARNSIPHTLKIEVEVETMEQIEEALKAGADIIMLDNMDIPAMKEAVAKINGRALVEASGNMGDKDLRVVAETGVDIISIGALTHSVKAMDISLKLY
ncbi:MAG: carboxylating nicotinate-nucleotide diphosphorylase [Clostridiales bacterium]|nr:carboxylating nicotinate-nucleotide diphosphorylase [Clostridiales bacterium]